MQMELKELIDFLNKLELSNIFNKLNKVRDDAIMVEIAVPDQRWEVEFMKMVIDYIRKELSPLP